MATSQPTTLKDLAERRSDIFHVDPRKLVMREGWNVRDPKDPDNIAHVAELSRQIESEGVKEPLTVFRDAETTEIVVTNGHCRLLATMQAIDRGAEIRTVPVKTEERGSNEADHAFSQIIRNSGKALSTLEFGCVCGRLVKFGWPIADIVKRSGKSITHVQQALSLLEAHPVTQQLVATGRVSATLAIHEGRKGKGNAKAVAERLAGAVAKAAAAGKNKATAKHMAEASAKKPHGPPQALQKAPEPPKEAEKDSPLEAIRAIVRGCQYFGKDPKDASIVEVRFVKSEWNRLVDLANIGLKDIPILDKMS